MRQADSTRIPRFPNFYEGWDCNECFGFLSTDLLERFILGCNRHILLIASSRQADGVASTNPRLTMTSANIVGLP